MPAWLLTSLATYQSRNIPVSQLTFLATRQLGNLTCLAPYHFGSLPDKVQPQVALWRVRRETIAVGE
jgi:hypothetical protein